MQISVESKHKCHRSGSHGQIHYDFVIHEQCLT